MRKVNDGTSSHANSIAKDPLYQGAGENGTKIRYRPVRIPVSEICARTGLTLHQILQRALEELKELERRGEKHEIRFEEGGKEPIVVMGKKTYKATIFSEKNYLSNADEINKFFGRDVETGIIESVVGPPMTPGWPEKKLKERRGEILALADGRDPLPVYLRKLEDVGAYLGIDLNSVSPDVVEAILGSCEPPGWPRHYVRRKEPELLQRVKAMTQCDY